MVVFKAAIVKIDYKHWLCIEMPLVVFLVLRLSGKRVKYDPCVPINFRR